ncbi:MAG: hypothetical protein WBP13_03635 [Methylophilaceae bacterium]
MLKNSTKTQNTIDKLVGADIRIEGNINFSVGLRIEGSIIGHVSEPSGSPSALILGKKGQKKCSDWDRLVYLGDG